MTPETKIEILKLEKAILELDSMWIEREKVFKAPSTWRRYVPSTNNYLVLILLVLSMLFVILFYFSNYLNGFNTVWLLFLIAEGLYYENSEISLARQCSEDKKSYIQQREQLEKQLKTLKNDT